MGIAAGRLQPRRPARPVRHELARAGPRGLPQPRRRLVRERPARRSPRAFGTNFTGWGDSWVDLDNDGTSTSCSRTARSRSRTWPRTPGRSRCSRTSPGELRRRDLASSGSAGLPRVNGRGVAAADFDNDGHLDVAINSIGGKLDPAPRHRRLGPLARGDAAPVRAGRGRHRDAPRRAQARRRRCTPARATSPPRTRASTSGSAARRRSRELTVRYPDGRTTAWTTSRPTGSLSDGRERPSGRTGPGCGARSCRT